MLFWITIIVLLVGIGLWIYGKKTYFHNEGNVCFVGFMVSVIFGIITLVMLVCIIANNFGLDAQIASHKARYEALTYKITADSYRDCFGILNKSVIDEVQDWNEDVVYYKNIQDDFWVGIFYQNIYDEFETIEYEKFERK